MFKPGDIVVCINSRYIYPSTLESPLYNIKKYSKYTIKMSDEYFNTVHLENIKGMFRLERFVSLKEYRKLKIKKLNTL